MECLAQSDHKIAATCGLGDALRVQVLHNLRSRFCDVVTRAELAQMVLAPTIDIALLGQR